MTTLDTERLWPPFALRIAASDGTNDIELRIMRDEDIAAINGVTAEEIYGPDVPRHAFGWLFGDAPSWSSAQFRWAHRATMSPQEWSLDCVVMRGGEVIGVVDMCAENFSVTREVETGSWLYHRVQGRGIGTLVRHAVAQFCFGYLGAASLKSGWVEGNTASAGVSAKLGYVVFSREDEGELLYGPDGIRLPHEYGRLLKEDYEQVHAKGATRVAVTGVTPALKELLGA